MRQKNRRLRRNAAIFSEPPTPTPVPIAVLCLMFVRWKLVIVEGSRIEAEHQIVTTPPPSPAAIILDTTNRVMIRVMTLVAMIIVTTRHSPMIGGVPDNSMFRHGKEIVVTERSLILPEGENETFVGTTNLKGGNPIRGTFLITFSLQV